jgi:hypothetical protein
MYFIVSSVSRILQILTVFVTFNVALILKCIVPPHKTINILRVVSNLNKKEKNSIIFFTLQLTIISLYFLALKYIFLIDLLPSKAFTASPSN